MKRALCGVVTAALLLGIMSAATSASAAPPNRTTFTLTCDRGTTISVVTVALFDSLGNDAGGSTLSCGPDSTSGSRSNRVVLMTSAEAVTATADPWTLTVGAASGRCDGAGPLPFKAECTDANGVGASLVVR